jgi:hypothetical protein
MRIAVILFLVLLAGCATRPPTQTSAYRAESTSGGVVIEADGAFVAKAGLWEASATDVARSAAIERLILTGVEQGYSHVIIDEERRNVLFGSQIAYAGKLYRSTQRGAWPLEMAREAAANIGTPYTSPEPMANTMRPANVRWQTDPADPQQPRRKLPASNASEPLPPATEDPIVIRAPDIISSLQGRPGPG